MSTMIALFLVLSTLAGCASETLVNVKNALPSVQLSYAVELETCSGTLTDSGGGTLVEYAYETPVLRVLRENGSPLENGTTETEQAALATAETFNTQFSAWESNALELLEAAKTDQEFRTETGLDGTPYTDELRCTVYQTASLISVSGVYYSFTGGAHGNTVLLSWNFDLETGAFFEAELLDEGSGLRAAVQNELVLQAREAAAENGQTPESFFWPDYAAILADWTNYTVSFDGGGMTVAFSPYELASYAAGPQVFQVSYEILRPYLSQHSLTLLGLDGDA